MSKPYRPSNSTEGDRFIHRWCHTCALWDPQPDMHGCKKDIIDLSLVCSIDDEMYPKELVIENGTPKCTAHIRFRADLDPDVEYLDKPDPTAAATAKAQEDAGQKKLFDS